MITYWLERNILEHFVSALAGSDMDDAAWSPLHRRQAYFMLYYTGACFGYSSVANTWARAEVGFIFRELTFFLFLFFSCFGIFSLLSFLYLCLSFCVLVVISFLLSLAVGCSCLDCLLCVLFPPVLCSSRFSLFGGGYLPFPSSGNLPGFKLFFSV